MIGGGVDMGLYNLSIGTASLFNVMGAGTDYQRWGNVINYGNMFTDISTSSINGLGGDFRNIKVYDSSSAFSVLSGDINGVFDNIKIYSVNTSAFYNDNDYLFGTFSNIIIHGTFGGFFGNSGLSGYFENIKGDNSISSIFYGSNYLNATLKNIEFNNLNDFCASNLNMDLIVDNIKIGNVSQNAFSTGGNITGTFSNIEIGSTNNLFHCSTSGDISGTYKDIVCNNTGAYGFMTISGTISGTFENITLGDTGEGYFRTDAVGGISGIFKNIEMGDITSESFYSSAAMNGTFSNIKTGNIDATAFYSGGGDISGTYEDIEIVEITSGNLFYSVGQMNGTFKNITCGTVASAFMYSETTISSTFSNIKVGNVGGDSFFADSGIDATATDITVGEVVSNIFSNTSGGISGYFENIYVKSVSGPNFFSTPDYLYGTFKNIYLGSSTDCQIFSVVSGPIDGTFQNIELFMDGITGVLFSGSSITGIFDNITNNLFTIGIPTIYLSAIFDTSLSAGPITGTFSNLYLGGASSAFLGDSILGTFKNINISCGDIFDGTIVLGTIEKSTIYGKILLWSGGRIVDTAVYANFLAGAVDVISLTGIQSTTIERCKFIGNSNGSTKSINGVGSVRISYTLTNKGIVGVTNLIGTPSNINDASIT
jgi:hypothetical protein